MKYKEISVFTTEAGLDAVCARFSMLGMEQLEIVQRRNSRLFAEKRKILGLCGHGRALRGRALRKGIY